MLETLWLLWLLPGMLFANGVASVKSMGSNGNESVYIEWYLWTLLGSSLFYALVLAGLTAYFAFSWWFLIAYLVIVGACHLVFFSSQ